MTEKNKYKSFTVKFLAITIIMLLMFVILTIFVDPFYHYHPPIAPIKLIPEKESYQNVGMARRLSYDAIITGSSMTENFKVSQFNELFNCNTVKLSFQGGKITNYEILLDEALKNKNNTIEKVFYGCDVSAYIDAPDQEIPNKIPEYLYDDNIFTDVEYLFNKTVMFKYVLPHLKYSIQNNIPNLDEAYTWYKDCVFEKEAMMKQYERPEQEGQKETTTLEKNVKINLDRMGKYLKENPEIEFNIFFPPYSILYYDSWKRTGKLEAILYAQEMIANYFVEFPNVKLSSFMIDENIICNLNNYKDYTHYSEKINEYIANSMKNETNIITKENCKEYFEKAKVFLCNYDYDSLFT